MSEGEGIQVIIRKFDGSQKNSVSVYPDETAGAIIKEIQSQPKWELDPKIAYQLTNTRTNTVFAATDFMTAELIQSGDILELQATLTAA